MSLEPIRDELFRKANHLGASSATAEIEQIKQIVVQQTRIGVRVVGYKNGLLKLAAEDSGAAAELFLHRAAITRAIKHQLGDAAVKQIMIVPDSR